MRRSLVSAIVDVEVSEALADLARRVGPLLKERLGLGSYVGRLLARGIPYDQIVEPNDLAVRDQLRWLPDRHITEQDLQDPDTRAAVLCILAEVAAVFGPDFFPGLAGTFISQLRAAAAGGQNALLVEPIRPRQSGGNPLGERESRRKLVLRIAFFANATGRTEKSVWDYGETPAPDGVARPPAEYRTLVAWRKLVTSHELEFARGFGAQVAEGLELDSSAAWFVREHCSTPVSDLLPQARRGSRTKAMGRRRRKSARRK